MYIKYGGLSTGRQKDCFAFCISKNRCLAADNIMWCLCGVLWAVLEDCKLGARAVFGRLFAGLLLSLWLLWSVPSEGSNEVDSAERGAAGTCTSLTTTTSCPSGMLQEDWVLHAHRA